MSRCRHITHRSDLVTFRTQKKEKVKVPIDLGWDAVRYVWETCDSGLFEDPSIRTRVNNRKHSTPKKKAIAQKEELI